MNPAGEIYNSACELFAGGGDRDLHDFHLLVAGRTVQLRFASEALRRRLCRTFGHLEAHAASSPDLVVWAFDGAAAIRELPAVQNAGASHGVIHYPGSPCCAVYPATGLAEAYFAEFRLGLMYLESADDLDPGYAAAPFQNIFHWWAVEQELQLLHGAAVGTREGVAILAGRGGSGKSTTALACLGAGLGLLSDDYCLVTPGTADTDPHAHTIYGSSKANARSLELVPRVTGFFEPAPLDPLGKSICYLADHVPAALLCSAPVRAIILPEVGHSATCKAIPISSGEALRALAPSTLFQLLGARGRGLRQIADIARRVTCWKLLLGPDPLSAPGVITTIIGKGSQNHGP